MCVLYIRPCRRPIWVGSYLGLVDMQGALPRFWCLGCGTEIFASNTDYCPKCKKEDEKDVYEA